MELSIHIATAQDIDAVLDIHRAAFGQETEAELVRDLLNDPTAQPSLSLVAKDGLASAGHILFTRVGLAGTNAVASILCPLAVRPEVQKNGAGSALIRTGLQHLRETGCDLVFVFGDPAYYGKFGFGQADFERFPTPQPIPDKYHPGWMVQSLSGDPVDRWQGQLTCADALNKPEYWSD